jgi:nitroreductase
LEGVILFATELGLGTCWLGGTFNRSGFATTLGIQSDEKVPAITPVGYVASVRGVRDRFLRWTANSKNRRLWTDLFSEGECASPLQAAGAGPYAPVLEAVRLAPSASNRQPWRVLKEQGRQVYHFYLHRSQSYTGAAKLIFGAEDIQRLDMGIAVCHFGLATRELGLPGRWEIKAPAQIALPERTEYVISWIGE